MKKTFAIFCVLIFFLSFFLFAFYDVEKGISANSIDDRYGDSFFLESLSGQKKISLAATLAKTAEEIRKSLRSRADRAISYLQKMIAKSKDFLEGKEKAKNIVGEGRKAGGELLEDNGFNIKNFFTDKINFILGKNRN